MGVNTGELIVKAFREADLFYSNLDYLFFCTGAGDCVKEKVSSVFLSPICWCNDI